MPNTKPQATDREIAEYYRSHPGTTIGRLQRIFQCGYNQAARVMAGKGKHLKEERQ